MTIPRKGSRTLDVDGKPFRFMVKERTSADEDGVGGELSVTVQEDAEPAGRCLQFGWPTGHAVTPEDVRAAVRDGMKAGWAPDAKGPAFKFAVPGAFARANDE